MNYDLRNVARRYEPVYVDRFQSAQATLVGYSVLTEGAVLAHFADGSTRRSIYRTERELVAAGSQSFRERVRLVAAAPAPPAKRCARCGDPTLAGQSCDCWDYSTTRGL